MDKTEHYSAVSEIAALLRDTTKKRLIMNESLDFPEAEYYNVLFSKEELQMIKNRFLKLVETL